MTSRRWIPVTAITTTAVLWTAYFVYLGFAEGANVGALPDRLEALVRTILTLATLAAIYVGVAARMVQQVRREQTRAETTLALPRAVGVGTVYAPVSTHRRRRPRRSSRAPIDPSTVRLMKRLDDELGRARGNTPGNTEPP